MHDAAAPLGIEVQVANPNREGWRWRNVKRKTDRDGAVKLARLSASAKLPKVWMPTRRLDFSRRGKATATSSGWGLIEAFNGHLRAESLNEN